jgi:Zn-dependent M28 family amino/carboxypeptidase
LTQQLTSTDSAAGEAALKAIRGEAIRSHMRFLSDSLLQGRAPGTAGYDIAAHYVATELEGMGVQPGANGSWYQPVPLRKAILDSAKSSLVLVGNGNEKKLTDGEDYVFVADVLRPESSVEAPLVFVGFGVTAPDQNYDDYAGVDVHSKIIVAIYGAPARFPSTERAYYSDGVVKAKNAVAHGATGILTIMLPEDQQRYPWAWMVPQIRMGEMHWLDAKGNPHNAFPQLRASALLNQHSAEVLFTSAAQFLDQAFAGARAGKPQSFALPWNARIHTASARTEINSPNIVGEIAGSDPAVRDQYVVYTAHVDHLGICPAINGDNVCHGALDNASGTASLLEVARAFASLPRPQRRSLLFVFVTGEEMGLRGSDYFAHFPTVPLEKIVANVNIDGTPGLLYPMKDVVALGIEHSNLSQDVEAASRQMGYEVSPDPMPEEVLFIRSDQYSFVLQGVPAVNPSDGTKSTDPKVNGLDVIKKWLTKQYHTPLDNMDQPLDYASAAKATGLTFLIGFEVAQQHDPPRWNEDDFFGAKFGPRHKGRSAEAD